MNMMDTRTVFQLFGEEHIKYRVPIYQRHYVWNETNWGHLWDDIKEKASLRLKLRQVEWFAQSQHKPHFTGVIVTRNEGRTLEIVDGQQRLTTFQIVLCAIRDICTAKFPGDSDSDEIAAEANKLLQNPMGYETELDLYKLLPTEGPDREAFRALVAGRHNDCDGLFLEAYLYFKEEIESYVNNDYKKMSTLARAFIFFDFQVVEMRLESTDQAAKIFESLNGRGLTLTQFDHIRNNVFLRAGDDKTLLYEKHWSHFNNISYWSSDQTVEVFLRNFLEAKLNRRFKSKGTLFDLYQQVYLRQLRSILNVNTGDEDNPKLVKREFEELEQYSRVYAEIAECNQESPMWFYQFLATQLRITLWHPFILLLKAELNISEQDFKLTLRILESYIVRCILCYTDMQESVRRRQFREARLQLVSLIRENKNGAFNAQQILATLNKNTKKFPKWPTDDQIPTALRAAGTNWSKRFIAYILFKIERRMTNPDFADAQLSSLEQWINLEHVMPRGWKNAKEEDSGEPLWPIEGTERERLERKFKRDSVVESIGNLTLLNEDLNKEGDDKSFAIKTELYGEHSRLSLTADILFDEDNVERTKWDVEEIVEREKKLIKLFCEIWPSVETLAGELE